MIPGEGGVGLEALRQYSGESFDIAAENRAASRSVPTYLAGVDSLRLIFAAIVVVGHLGIPGLGLAPWMHYLGVSINAPAAVLGFFLISGLCIHHAYGRRERLDWRAFYVARLLRIGPPLLLAKVLQRTTGIGLEHILWSIYSELIYYACYPLLLRLRAKWSWRAMIGVAFVLSFLVILTNPAAKNYPSFGVWGTALLGLPVWLLGCQLAETWRVFPSITLSRIWMWRGAVWMLSVVLLVLNFHSPLGYPWTLNGFGVFAYFWLERELGWMASHPAPRLLEIGGKGSYSLYLMHPLGSALLIQIGVTWLLFQYAAAFVACAICYFLVERPAHQLAKKSRALFR